MPFTQTRQQIQRKESKIGSNLMCVYVPPANQASNEPADGFTDCPRRVVVAGSPTSLYYLEAAKRGRDAKMAIASFVFVTISSD